MGQRECSVFGGLAAFDGHAVDKVFGKGPSTGGAASREPGAVAGDVQGPEGEAPVPPGLPAVLPRVALGAGDEGGLGQGPRQAEGRQAAPPYLF